MHAGKGTGRRTLRVVVDDSGPFSLKHVAKPSERRGPTHVVPNEPAF